MMFAFLHGDDWGKFILLLFAVGVVLLIAVGYGIYKLVSWIIKRKTKA